MNSNPTPMTTASLSSFQEIGFAYVKADTLEWALPAPTSPDWHGFAATWNDLGLDTYMADGGRYRRRRFGVFAVDAEHITRKPHQPHYQSRDYNPLNGGIERWFAPLSDAFAEHALLQQTLRTCYQVFTALTPSAQRPEAWHVECHQFRIEAHAEQQGLPTPEGLHRDGVDWVLVLLVERCNIVEGETSIHDLQQQFLGGFTLSQPGDAALVNDARVYHGVTPVRPMDVTQSAYRDVLVVTFRR